LIKIDNSIKNRLKKSKNLLAFSAGIDSTALFFILVENSIEFDIAIVDYHIRDESKDEVKYAHSIAKKYNKKIFLKSIKLNNKNFEHNARDIRYNFFQEIIQEYHYSTLLTAHQLNDRLEWFLMQLTRGAGINELYGINDIQNRDGYKIIRPLLQYSKEELKAYLDKYRYKYFIDSSNQNEKYRRNYFRHNYSDKLIKSYKDGILKSFNYIKDDTLLMPVSNIIYNNKDYYIIENSGNNGANIRVIDQILKKLGLLISSSTRKEIIQNKECVVSHKIAIVFQDDKIYIAPYIKIKMDKDFKEKMRIKKIPSKVRGYLYQLN